MIRTLRNLRESQREVSIRFNTAPGTAFATGGPTLAVHDSSGTFQTSPFTLLTSVGYSGEFFAAAAQQQYLRARFYNPANGRFNRLDPFAGNTYDPQSPHKYHSVDWPFPFQRGCSHE